VCGVVTREDVAAVVIKALLSDKAKGKVRRRAGCKAGREQGRQEGVAQCD